ncbi:lipase 3-like [Galleria mellonella]|uniref:Lipase n=1 Tax=Galleria mellonella TaxID=7137 RepID=A0ABM3N784_GALME|nr:lipase 3-like [Galleria mellonella]
MFKFLIFAVLVTAAVARRSPNADFAEKYFQKYGGRYSTDVIEDALLDVPDLITKYRYPVEVHKLVTKDKYVLELHRIPHGRDKNNQPDPNKPVVFIMHGLLSSSAEFVVLGPRRALAYILAEAGYDVWMGNARGNYYSRENLVMSPNDRRNADFWRFSWDEIGNIDLPTFIDYVLEVTGKSKLHYIGHSQGCTAFLVLNSLRPEYNEKFLSFQAMAPAAFFIYNEMDLLRNLGPYEAPVKDITYGVLKVGEVLGKNEVTTWIIVHLCREGTPFHDYCTTRIKGDNEPYINSTLTPLILGHAPAGSSLLQLGHFSQCYNSKDFRRYNHLPIKNIERYGRPVPPSYDLSQITTPVYIHYGLGDIVTGYKDTYHLASKLPNLVGMYEVKRPSFNHFDFVWGVDAREQVYDTIVGILQELDGNKQ